MAKDASRRYRLGARMGRLAQALLAQVSAPAYLVEPLHERASAPARRRTRRPGAATTPCYSRSSRASGLHLGYSGAAHVRASGKVLLAYGRPGTLEDCVRTHAIASGTLRAEIDAVRSAGYAVDEEQFAEGVSCIAAPVADGTMAIGVSVPAERYRSLRGELIGTVVAVAGSAAAPQMPAAGEA